MRVRSKVLLLIWLLVLFFKNRKSRTRFNVTKGTLPPIKRSARNHLMNLGSDEEFMLFLGISRSAFEVLLDSFDSVWRRQRKRFSSSADSD